MIFMQPPAPLSPALTPPELESLKERHEQGQLHSVEFLKQLLDLPKDVLEAEKDTPCGG